MTRRVSSVSSIVPRTVLVLVVAVAVAVAVLVSRASTLASAQSAYRVWIGNYGSSACASLLDATPGRRVQCWGSNADAQLGLSDKQSRGRDASVMGNALPALDLGTGLTASTVSTSSTFACAGIRETGGLKCWGNIHGAGSPWGPRLETMGDALPFIPMGTGVRVESVASTRWSTCVLLRDAGNVGRVKCFGENGGGILGTGDRFDRFNVTTLGDALPFVNLGTGRSISYVGTGSGASCALDQVKGQVLCWGQAPHHGLDVTKRYGENATEMGNALPVVNLGTGAKVRVLSVGFAAACAILDTAKVKSGVKCWGDRGKRSLGYPDDLSRGAPLYPYGNLTMGDRLPFVALGSGRVPVAVTVGYFATCVLFNTQRVGCVGYNPGGLFGVGGGFSGTWDADTLGNKLPISDFGGSVVSISLGYALSCALMGPASGSVVRCFGRNDQGQLGWGTNVSQWGSVANQIGDGLPRVLLAATPLTSSPTKRPTRGPVVRPTRQPTKVPTSRPSRAPTARPSRSPTVMPTPKPTVDPRLPKKCNTFLGMSLAECNALVGRFRANQCQDVMKDFDPPALWIPQLCSGPVGKAGCRLATDCSIPCALGCAKHKFCEWRGGSCKNKITGSPSAAPVGPP